jgi:purine nucleosidase
MTPRPIIIDTDPGTDDAIAIWLALASPELEVVGISAVAGNVPLRHTEKNARKVCELARRPDIKIFAGCARPMLRPLVTAEEFHGHTGLGDTVLPEPAMPLQAAHAVDWLVDTLLAAGVGEITLCPIGPLTNIAMAFVREPRIGPKIREIVLMGGGFFEGGNITPAAEFNVYCDPHAAEVVFTSGVKLTMMPLDVTHQARTTGKRIASVRAIGTPVGLAAAAMMAAHGKHAEKDRDRDGGPLHDPCVIAYLLRPELFAGRSCNVRVETGSELTMGMTVVDWWGVTGGPKNCTVINRIDADGYFTLIAERLAKL